MESETRVRNVVKAAEWQPDASVSVAELDTNPNLFNLENGTLELFDHFRLRNHSRNDLQGKLAPVSYDKDAQCPRFMKFIADFTSRDHQLAAFLQTVLGTTVLGANPDRVIIALEGGGRNGKSVLIETLNSILGHYSQTAPSHLLALKQDGGASPEIAQMQGVRLLVLDDPNIPNRQDGVAVDMLKRISGDQTMTGRHLHKGFITFKGQATPIIAWNKAPNLSGGGGTAIWDRLVPIPCKHRVTNPDTALKDRLWQERSGILNWLLVGLKRRNKQNGIGEIPECVVDLQNEIKGRKDSAQTFVDRMICDAVGKSITASELYDAYQAWCEESGEFWHDQKRFKHVMVSAGYAQKKSNSLWWQNVELIEA